MKRQKNKKIDENPKCPKCKKPLEECGFMMMGIDKKCFEHHVNWMKHLGFLT